LQSMMITMCMASKKSPGEHSTWTMLSKVSYPPLLVLTRTFLPFSYVPIHGSDQYTQESKCAQGKVRALIDAYPIMTSLTEVGDVMSVRSS
jgi:hypothetical protein